MKNPLHNLTDSVKAFSAKKVSAVGHKKAGMTLDISIPRNWPEEKKVRWCLRNGIDVTNEGTTEDLSELIELQANAKTVIWSPAADSLLIEANLPTRSRAKINQALPFALEEQLLNPPEQEHFVYQVRPGLPLAVTVTSKSKLTKWLTALQDAGLRPPSAMYPMVTGLARENDNWSMTIIGNELLVRTGDYNGFSCILNGEQPPVQLSNAINSIDIEHKPKTITYFEIDNQLDTASWSAALGTEITTVKTDYWSILQTEHTKLNLLQGDFKQKRELNPAISRFAPAAAILAIWFVVSLFVNIWEWRVLKSTHANTNKEMHQIFKSTFPDAKTIVDPALQMQRKFEALSGKSGGYLKHDFLSILTKCAPALSALDTGSIENLRYNEKSLDISLGLPDFKSLEALKDRLSINGMQVEVVAANSRADGIEGRLKITIN